MFYFNSINFIAAYYTYLGACIKNNSVRVKFARKIFRENIKLSEECNNVYYSIFYESDMLFKACKSLLPKNTIIIYVSYYTAEHYVFNGLKIQVVSIFEDGMNIQFKGVEMSERLHILTIRHKGDNTLQTPTEMIII